MAKKIKKKAPVQEPIVELEDVSQDQAFECELDTDTREIVFVNHYRREWGDGFDADVEHGMTIDETKQFIVALLGMIDELEKPQIVVAPIQSKEEEEADTTDIT